MNDTSSRDARPRVTPPRRANWLLRAGVFALIAAAGAAGYLAYRYHEETGRMPHEDMRHTRQWLVREKRRLISDADEAIKNGTHEAQRVFETAKKRFATRRAALEDWFADKELRPPTRDELLALAEQYETTGPARGRRESRRQERATEAPRKPTRSPRRRDAASAGPEAQPAAAPPRADDGRSSEPPRARAAPTATTATSARHIDTEVLDAGLAEFNEGVTHWKAAGEPGSPDEQRRLAVAREHFENAQTFLEHAAKERPDDEDLQRLLTDTNRFLYDCMKRTKLDLAP